MKKALVLLAALALFASVAMADVFNETASTQTAAQETAGQAAPFGPLGAVGGMDGGPLMYNVVTPGNYTIQIADCCLVGDVYDLTINGTAMGSTSVEPIGGTTNSTGTWVVSFGAGMQTIGVTDITLTYVGSDSPFGGGMVTSDYDPAGFTITITPAATPEPASLILLASGLMGLAGLRARGKQE